MSNTTSPKTRRASSAEIDYLVERYRSGDGAAAEELLECYDWYMKKWLRLLTTAKWDKKDREIAHFLSMVGSVDINSSAHILRHRLRIYEKDDLLQEVKISLLDTALKYRNIVAQYRFVLWARLKYLLDDTIVSYRDRGITLDAVDLCSEDVPDLDAAWVEGITCGAGFDELTPQDRLILLFTKWHGFSIDQTANLLGVSAATIDRSINRSKGILRVHYFER